MTLRTVAVRDGLQPEHGLVRIDLRKRMLAAPIESLLIWLKGQIKGVAWTARRLDFGVLVEPSDEGHFRQVPQLQVEVLRGA